MLKSRGTGGQGTGDFAAATAAVGCVGSMKILGYCKICCKAVIQIPYVPSMVQDAVCTKSASRTVIAINAAFARIL